MGLLINPYFPHNMVFASLHILPKLFGGDRRTRGQRMVSLHHPQLMKNSPLALVAFFSGALALGMSGKRMELRTAISFLLACLFGLMLLQSRRFIEYFPAFSLVFAAFAWTPLFDKKQASGTTSEGTGLLSRFQERTTEALAGGDPGPACWSRASG